LQIGSTDHSQDDLLNEALDGASAFIDTTCHRWFNARRQTRYFAPDALDPDVDPLSPRYVGISGGNHGNVASLDRRAYRRLFVDQDLLDIYSVTNGDGTLIPSNGYWAEPRNETPHSAVTLTATYSWTWDSDGWVAIDANWGYSETPPAIVVSGTLRLAEHHYRSRAVQGGSTTMTLNGALTQYPPGFPTDVISSLGPLVRLSR
jgi:hypothetical protein